MSTTAQGIPEDQSLQAYLDTHFNLTQRHKLKLLHLPFSMQITHSKASPDHAGAVPA